MKILIVEDDRKLASFLTRAFSEDGDVVDNCRSGRAAVEQISDIRYDLVVLDWMLPEEDGVSVCRRVRLQGNRVPILMVTARNEVGEKVTALNAGADDYLTKPFHLDELLARARSLTRRSLGTTDILRVGHLTVDLRTQNVHVDGRRIELTGREYTLLSLLIRNAGRVVTRSEILNQVWNSASDPGSNVIEVNIRHLREKLESAAVSLETVRGQGYRFRLTESD